MEPPKECRAIGRDFFIHIFEEDKNVQGSKERDMGVFVISCALLNLPKIVMKVNKSCSGTAQKISYHILMDDFATTPFPTSWIFDKGRGAIYQDSRAMSKTKKLNVCKSSVVKCSFTILAWFEIRLGHQIQKLSNWEMNQIGFRRENNKGERRNVS